MEGDRTKCHPEGPMSLEAADREWHFALSLDMQGCHLLYHTESMYIFCYVAVKWAVHNVLLTNKPLLKSPPTCIKVSGLQ